MARQRSGDGTWPPISTVFAPRVREAYGFFESRSMGSRSTAFRELGDRLAGQIAPVANLRDAPRVWQIERRLRFHRGEGSALLRRVTVQFGFRARSEQVKSTQPKRARVRSHSSPTTLNEFTSIPVSTDLPGRPQGRRPTRQFRCPRQSEPRHTRSSGSTPAPRLPGHAAQSAGSLDPAIATTPVP